MRILFVSHDLLGGNIAHLLLKEGHEVRLYIDEEDRRANFTNMVPKTLDWKSDLEWVGKDGLIIFDDVGYGLTQDLLRKDGYTVFGGSEKGDLLEQNRTYGQEVFSGMGMTTLPTYDFHGIEDAIEFVKQNPAAWVVKQNGTANKGLNYVGVFADGRDVLDVLEAYKINNVPHSQVITLQKRVEGVEIAITRYFNGNDWVGPMLINAEHKKFFPGDLGPTTSEMGTIGWYETDEDNSFFRKTLAKLKPYLQQIGYQGIFDINCIVNEEGAFPLEATSRVGSPIIHLQTELNHSPWGELMLAIARGKKYDVQYKDGVGVVIVIAIPPFPYSKKMEGVSQIGTEIHFLASLSGEERSHIHFEEVSKDPEKEKYYISDNRGYILYVTGQGSNAEDACRKAYAIINKIHIPKMIYRNDLGKRFTERDLKKLREWGYLSPEEKESAFGLRNIVDRVFRPTFK